MKSKFFCFRPLGIETESEPNGPDCFGDRAFTCITLPNYKDAKISVSKSPVLDSENLKSSKISIKSDSSRLFSRVLKAVLFEISLRKKAGKRKAPQLMLGSESSDSNPSKSPENTDTDLRRIKGKSPTTSKNSSDKKSSSKTQSNSSKQRKQRTRDCPELKTQNNVTSTSTSSSSSSSSNSGFLLILIALLTTVFCGRVCAILFTCLFLYFLPRRNICERRSENTTVISPKKESAAAGDDKKRVIMEGLLERNHQRRGH
ncbi:unnamed protein product [Camellia sinensis]